MFQEERKEFLKTINILHILDLGLTEDEFKEFVAEHFDSTIKGDSETLDFLLNEAYHKDLKNDSRTYLIVKNDRVDDILGYFTITYQKINMLDDIGSSNAKKFGAIKIIDEDGNKKHIFSSILIGQFARNNLKYSNKEVTGINLMSCVLSKIKQVFDLIGGFVITVDCVDQLVDFYKKFGFLKIAKRNNLNQMYVLTKHMFESTN